MRLSLPLLLRPVPHAITGEHQWGVVAASFLVFSPCPYPSHGSYLVLTLVLTLNLGGGLVLGYIHVSAAALHHWATGTGYVTCAMSQEEEEGGWAWVGVRLGDLVLVPTTLLSKVRTHYSSPEAGGNQQVVSQRCSLIPTSKVQSERMRQLFV